MILKKKPKFKIAVVGIGGVGGYIGGKLAARYADSETVEIILAARGANEKAIRNDGLKLITTDGEQTVRPKLVLATTEIGEPDLILLCTKEYDLEETIGSLKSGIGEQTTILPLLNGVDTAERIAAILPRADVWQGCIYIVSRLAAPGVIRETGNVCLIYFGGASKQIEKMRRVETIFREAGIEAHLSEDIAVKMWEKFVFISSVAAATAYLNASISEILSNDEHQNLLFELLGEVKRLAKAKRVNISEDAVQKTFDRLNSLPFEATSSLHTDFSQGKRAELQSLIGYVVEQARQSNVPTPVYAKIYEELAEKQKAMPRG